LRKFSSSFILGIVNKLTILKHWAAILQVWASFP